MHQNDHDQDEARQRMWASLFLFCFGVGTLIFLTAIERQSWFHLRPASGAAAAMFYASDNAAEHKD